MDLRPESSTVHYNIVRICQFPLCNVSYLSFCTVREEFSTWRLNNLTNFKMTINRPIKLVASSYLRNTCLSFAFILFIIRPPSIPRCANTSKLQSKSSPNLIYFTSRAACHIHFQHEISINKSLLTLFCDDEGCTRITADFWGKQGQNCSVSAESTTSVLV